jgi:hypothetical protein
MKGRCRSIAKLPPNPGRPIWRRLPAPTYPPGAPILFEIFETVDAMTEIEEVADRGMNQGPP